MNILYVRPCRKVYWSEYDTCFRAVVIICSVLLFNKTDTIFYTVSYQFYNLIVVTHSTPISLQAGPTDKERTGWLL